MDALTIIFALTTLLFLLSTGIFAVAWSRLTHQQVADRENLLGVLTAVGAVVAAVDEFAAVEKRTMDSLEASGLSEVRHPAVRNARLRGLEEYRNGYVARHQSRIHTALAQYNESARPLLQALGVLSDDA